MVENKEPITVIISRRVKPEMVKEFESLTSEMTERASRFPGYLGTTLFKPSSSIDPEYRIMFKFQDMNSLQEWEGSSQRAEILEKIEDLLITTSEREQVSVPLGLPRLQPHHRRRFACVRDSRSFAELCPEI